MTTSSFTDMLLQEIRAMHLLLVGLYSQRDRLLYQESPRLRNCYLEIFGSAEDEVLKMELDLYLLEKKQALIQAAVNRREPIDLDAINTRLEEERKKKIAELESSDRTLQDLPQLSEEASKELQTLYHAITEQFHPSVNPNITETEKMLYAKALDAYQRMDLPAMKLIHSMLFESHENLVPLDLSSSTTDEDLIEIARALNRDYALVEKVFSMIRPTEEQAGLQSRLKEYKSMRLSLEEDIRKIQESFPFNAEVTINDEAKKQEYLQDLALRKRNCQEKMTALSSEIETMLKEHTNAEHR